MIIVLVSVLMFFVGAAWIGSASRRLKESIKENKKVWGEVATATRDLKKQIKDSKRTKGVDKTNPKNRTEADEKNLARLRAELARRK